MVEVIIPEVIEIDGRKVEVEITKNPQLLGAYDNIQDVIFLNHNLLNNPELLKYVLDHEKHHAKYPKGIFIQTWIDIKNWCLRPWKTRKAIKKLLNLNRYWRSALSNLLLSFFFIFLIAAPLFLIFKILEWFVG